MTNCKIEGCTETVAVALRGLCKNHYYTWAKHNKPKGKKPCAVEDCDKHLYARGWCLSHYNKWRAYGTPTPEPKSVEPHYCECGEPVTSRGLCRAHYYHWHRENLEGSDVPINNKKDVVKYLSMHIRIKRARGRASTYECVDCLGPARDWSLKHDAQDTIAEESGRYAGSRYSLDVYDYEPRCGNCHKAYDKRHENRKARTGPKAVNE